MEDFVPLVCVDNVFLGRYVINRSGIIKNVFTNKVFQKIKSTASKPYPVVSFRVGNIKKTYRIHILVAKTFIENPFNLKEVDHIDRDVSNYSADNLRWVSRRDNILNREKPKKRYIKINKIDDYGNLINEYDVSHFDKNTIHQIHDASRLGIKRFGYYWKVIDHRIDRVVSVYGIPDEQSWFRWKDTNVYCTNTGLVKVRGKNSKIYTAGNEDSFGHMSISYNKKKYFVHRLVYEIFNGCDIMDGYVIDHINGIPYDNRLCNLRLVTQKDNMSNPNTIRKLSKAVCKYTLSGEYVETFYSMNEATKNAKLKSGKWNEDTNFSDSNIRDNTIRLCCDRKTNTAYGYIYCYENDLGRIDEAMNDIVYEYDCDSNYIRPVIGRLSGKIRSAIIKNNGVFRRKRDNHIFVIGKLK